MIDYLWTTRQALIENFQTSMKAIRLLMGYSMAELADYVGVTRQTINNLESGKSKMSVMQFLSLAAVVDHYIAANGEMYQAIETILDGGGRKPANRFGASFSGFSLLKRWFLLFEEAGEELPPGGALDDFQLRQLVRGYKIFLDDTALLSDQAEAFLRFLSDDLTAENEKLILPLRCVERIQEQTQDPACSRQAVRALRLLNGMQQKGIVQIRGEAEDANHHDTILSVFLRFRGTYRLCLITQDRAFAGEVLRLNGTRDPEGFRIVVGRIAGEGRLALYGGEETETDAGSGSLPEARDGGAELAPAPPEAAEDNGQDGENGLSAWEYL